MSDLSTQYRTHTCGELRPSHDGGEATLAGHVDRKPDSDGRFLVRDRYGKTLIGVHAEALPYVAERIAGLNREDVVQVTGVVALRDEKEKDHRDLATGAIRLEAKKLEVLSAAAPIPPGVLDAKSVPLEERIAFRPLYLRRPEMRERLELRARLAAAIRGWLVANRFAEIETPHLFWYDRVALASEPIPVEGGKAFALPSGGLVLDQYIVAGQFERFFQFLRITRREMRQVTPMHAPEHTLLDINLAYVDVADFCAVIEGLLAHVFKQVLAVELKTPFLSLTYAEAMAKYGTDKVDARFGCELEEVKGNAGVRRFRVPGAAGKLKDEELSDLLASAAGSAQREGADLVVTAPAGAAGTLRLTFARRLGLVPPGAHAPVWIRDYPMLTKDEGALVPGVVVFTQPKGSAMADLAEDPERIDQVLGNAFDLVLDGVEIASAYIGNHDLRTQRFVWDEIFRFGTPDLVRVRAPVESHRFGVPPHGGINIGFDRLVALLLGLEAIDEAMFFPKTQDCRDPLLDAPGPVPLAAVVDLVGEAPPAEAADEQLVQETIDL